MRTPSNKYWYKGETEEEAKERHALWEKKTRETKEALGKTFPTFNELIGQAIWHHFINKRVYLPNDDSNYDVGRSFRSWGALFGEMVDGTDYLDYYCNMINIIDPDFTDWTLAKLKEDGWVLEELS